MGVYDIVTPDNMKQPPARRGPLRQRDFSEIVEPNTLFFSTGNYNDGITIDLSGQVIKQIDEDTWLLQPSNVTIQIVFQSVKLTVSGMTIKQPIIVGEYEGEDEADEILDELRHFLDRLLVKQVGKEAGLVSRLEIPPKFERRAVIQNNLPYGVKGVISSFLTGKTGSLGSQTNKLQQNLGTAMAPRPRRRKTRRRRS